MSSRRLVPALLSLAASAAVALTGPVAASAAPPVSDPNASGYLGFCDRSGHQVRGGALAGTPFAWKTVSSVAAPAGYQRAKASIVGFQPRPQVDPYDWSGKPLTAASTFSNPRHPMAAATAIDSSFGDFTGTYTPQVQGLIQLRMIFTGVGLPQYSGSYPALLVKITGSRWQQVGGGPVDCTSGSARSVELDSLPAARLEVNHARPAPETARQLRAQRSSSRGSGAVGSTTAGRSASPDASATTGSAAVNSARPASAERAHGAAGGAVWPWLVAAGLVLVLAAGAVVARRRAV